MPVTGLLQPADLELSEAVLDELAQDAIVWASQHGLVSECSHVRALETRALTSSLHYMLCYQDIACLSAINVDTTHCDMLQQGPLSAVASKLLSIIIAP